MPSYLFQMAQLLYIFKIKHDTDSVHLSLCSRIKGTVPRDFQLQIFFLNQFPQAPEYTIRTISNFVKNFRRYSQLKVHHRCCWHRWQMEKFFNQNSFNYLFYTFELSSMLLFPLFATGVNDNGGKFAAVSLIPAAICHRCRWHRWQFPTCINNTSGTGGKICHWCTLYRCTVVHLHLRISPQILENFVMTLMLFSGIWEKMRKNMKQKIAWHCPWTVTLY